MKCFLCGSQEAKVNERENDFLFTVKCQACGRYNIEDLALDTDQVPQEKRYLLSAITRRASDAGKHITITTDNISQLLDSIPNLTTPLENIDHTLLVIKQKQKRADDFILLKLSQDYPLVFAHDGEELGYFLKTLVEQGFLEPKNSINWSSTSPVRLTPAGWQRAIELQKTQSDSNQAFVAMWFNPELISVWQDGFKPALEATGFNPYRVDRAEYNGKIDDQIIAEIRRSGLLVADFTGQRGGVYFEAGFAMGLGLPVIYTCRESDIDDCHFDTRQYNHITWNSADELKTKLINRIRATIPWR